MGNFFLKLFIKNHEDTASPKVRESYGKFAGLVGILSNLGLCVAKVALGLITGSIAILADGINNLADTSSSIITLLGFKLAALPEDREHPYGHARIEYLTGLLISGIIIIVGVQLLLSSVDRIRHPQPQAFDLLTIVILAVAMGVKLWQAYFYVRLGKRIDSLTLIATGTDSRNDVIATAAVLAGVMLQKFAGLDLDGIIGCLVALFIIWSGISLVRETSSPLLGEAPSQELVNAIYREIESHDEVLGVHDLMVHNYGAGKIFASVHIEVDGRGDMMALHDVVDNIERTLSKKLHIHLVAHMDPIITDDPRIIELTEIINKVFEDIPGISGLHDLRITPGPTHTNVIFDAVYEPDCKLKQADVRDFVQKKVAEVNPDYHAVITFDRFYSEFES